MNIIVFGASGATGRELIRQALGRGHAVCGFVRDAGQPATEGVRLIQGDARDQAAVSSAVAGQDAVLTALGARTLGRSNLLRQSSANIIAAMEHHRVRRLIALGAAGALRDASANQSLLGRAFLKLLVRTLLRNLSQDQAAQEMQIETSGLDYTIVRPPFLTNKPPDGQFRVALNGLPPRWAGIARADVAAFMVDQLESRSFVRMGPYLSN